ncbi:Glycerol-3-phosphate dehydrogenase [Vigna angularis]|uniref:Glycerol-3-phosphate dehydrogenase n=1 Tax=Phaseolus angularis TaxID=3914 RepID=A0A8T0KP31_PHAAN|nr:Glycerol-3-phosphate dehydrogenase [Vigna angularis]
MTRLRKLGAVTATAIAAAYGGAVVLHDPLISASDYGGNSRLEALRKKVHDPGAVVPAREAQQSVLAAASKSNPLDVLVIGGGATGSGAALDAVTRGLRVGLVEREDFAAGTSSRSTKLLHGGVRYLEKAVFNLDYGQFKLVLHALEERKQVIDNAPHLCHALPCMTPCFSWFEVVYYWMGLKMYDLVAGRQLLHISRYYSTEESVDLFPTLARKMNDARLNVGLACTAALAGAAVLNHAEVVSLLKDDDGKRIIGARIRDSLTGNEFDTYAKVIVNASGPFCDSIRKMANKNAQQMISPSSGVRRGDVLSAWSGIRPLALDPTAKNTESISRDHVVCEDYPGLVTITGGKWTTYRSMAEDAVNAAIKSGKLSPTSRCVTNNLRLVGGEGWERSSFTVLAQQYTRMKSTHSGKVVPGVMDSAAARHLSHAYGTLAERVAAIAQGYEIMVQNKNAPNESLGKRLAHGYPYLEAEVAYCARNEYCESAVDFIARRTRLAFLETDAAQKALPRVIEILAKEHKWNDAKQKEELEKATEFLRTFKSSRNAKFHDGKHS